MNNEYIERFRKLWKETSDTVMYRVTTEKNSNPFVSTGKINRIISEEVIEKRWISTGITHAAKQFIDDLAMHDQNTSETLVKKISTFKISAGLNYLHIAVCVIIAATGIIVAVLHKLPIVGVIASSVASIGIIGTLIKGRGVKAAVLASMNALGVECEDTINEYISKK